MFKKIISFKKYLGFKFFKPVEAIIPQVKLSDVIPDNVSIQVRKPSVIRGNISLFELLSIIRFIKYYNIKSMFEIGTFDGRTTLNMAANSSSDASVYTLDLPKSEIKNTKFPITKGRSLVDKEISGICYRGADCEYKIHQLYGDSATFDIDSYERKMDFVFIDGAHTYDYVLNDSNLAMKLIGEELKGGGIKKIIFWHDYGHKVGVADGVTLALNKLYIEDSRFRNLRRIEGTVLVYLIVD